MGSAGQEGLAASKHMPEWRKAGCTQAANSGALRELLVKEGAERGHKQGEGGSWPREQYLPDPMPLNSIYLLQQAIWIELPALASVAQELREWDPWTEASQKS